MTLGRIPRKGPASVPDLGRLVPLEAATWGDSKTSHLWSVSPRAGRTFAAAVSSTTSPVTACRTFSPPLSTPSVGASFYVNKGDGSFEDRSVTAGLADQIYALNVSRADFDNDGDLDVVLLRGGWERPLRLSLLKNRGDGTFADVTMASGLGEPIQTEAAAWGDFDNDGWVDLFVCGEYVAPGAVAPTAKPDRRNRCRLYRNLRDGTFTDVAAKRESSTSVAPRARPGAITIATAGSTSSSRTWARTAACTTMRGAAISRRRRRVRHHRGLDAASPAGSGTTTTMASSTSMSTTTRPAWPRSSPAPPG